VHVVAGGLEQVRGDRRVDAARETDDDALAATDLRH
jgi:hypothetical protein